MMTAEWKNPSGAVDTIAILPDGSQVLSSTLNTIFLWRPGTPHPIAQLPGHSRTIWALAITFDGRVMASGSWDRSIRLWDVSQHRPLRTLIGHSDIILALTVAMSDCMLISASRDGTLKCWELPGGRQIRSIRHPGGAVWSVAALLSDDMVAAGAENGMVGLWSLTSGKAVWCISLGEAGPVHRLLLLHSQKLLCITQKGLLAFLDIATGAIQQISIPPATYPDNAVVLHTDVIYSDAVGKLYRWNVDKAQQLLAIQAHHRRIPAMAVQATRGVVATGSEDQSIKLWRFCQVPQLQMRK